MKWSAKLRENALIFKQILPTINSLRDQSGVSQVTIGSLNRGVFWATPSTRMEAFSLLICLDAKKFILLSFWCIIK